MQTELSRKKKKLDEDHGTGSLEKEALKKWQNEARNLEIIVNNAKNLIVISMLKLGKLNHRISEITGVKVEP